MKSLRLNEVALKQIHSLRLRFLHNIRGLDRHRKNVNKTGLILGESQCGHLPSWARGVIDWPLFLCETLVLHKKQTRSRELLVKIMNTGKPRTVTLRISSDFSKGKYALWISRISRIDFGFWSYDCRDHQFLKLINCG